MEFCDVFSFLSQSQEVTSTWSNARDAVSFCWDLCSLFNWGTYLTWEWLLLFNSHWQKLGKRFIRTCLRNPLFLRHITKPSKSMAVACICLHPEVMLSGSAIPSWCIHPSRAESLVLPITTSLRLLLQHHYQCWNQHSTASRVNGNRTLVMLLYEIRSN